MAGPDIQRAALLLLDLQRDALHPNGGAAGNGLAGVTPGDAGALLAVWQQLADTMRAANRPVVWITTAFRPDYRDAAVAAPWLEARRAPGRDFLVEGTAGAQLLDGLEADPHDYFVVKKAHGAFAGTPLDRLLANLDVDECIIAGGGVADSVTETVRTGGILGYRTFVVKDAVYPPAAPELDIPGLRVAPAHDFTSAAEVLDGTAGDQHATGTETQEPPEYALLIVDMQNDFVSPDRPAVRYAGAVPISLEGRERILRNARRLAAAVRERGWPVVYVSIVQRADHLDSVQSKGDGVAERIPSSVPHITEGTWGAEIANELTPEPNDFVLTKKGASAFGLTHLHRLLRNLRVRRCLVAGGSITGCVRATVFDGVAFGYDMSVLSDATYPPDSPPAHMDFLGRWCAVRATNDVVSEISAIRTL